jgi:transposase
MQALSGNTNDAKAFAEVAKKHISSLQAAQNSRYFIGDAALYTLDTIQALHKQNQKFITRVPMTLNLAKEALLNLSPDTLSDMRDGYSGRWVSVDYAGVPQRCLLVRSEQATKREMITWDKNLNKLDTKERKAFEKLTKKEFAFEVDARTAATEFVKQCQYLHFQTLTSRHTLYSMGAVGQVKMLSLLGINSASKLHRY